ncbi:1-acyl-sn-glycerol-3-phosphate acyltransferase beta [Onthophagus taurus]|uniref:1-acyl-sn-glycerol-3-phosphate acyltransferase beta n=1 Tax=Onthophagus taurus TaxID=166361 RepID=UPI000C208ECD|nr:1-acyl-sn-glycerol-3-phosphate acyltransferase beta [Onthophagus taurus]
MGYWLWIIMVIIFWIVLWKTSSVARYYFKFSIFALASVVFATTPIPFMLLKPKDSKNALIPAAGLRLAAKLMGVKCIVHGKENIVKDSGCVVVINHQSVIDLIVLAELWPIMDRCTVISKKEIFYIWPFGLAAWLWGTIFIDRLNAGKAQNAINSTGKLIRERKSRVLMFPEGTRSLKDKLLPFKKGAFHLAIASQCPVQPVVVNRYTFLGNARFDDGEIHITILPQIETVAFHKQNIRELIDHTYNVMSSYLENLDRNPNNNIDKVCEKMN